MAHVQRQHETAVVALTNLLRGVPDTRAHVGRDPGVKGDVDTRRRAGVHAQRVGKRVVSSGLFRREGLLLERNGGHAVRVHEIEIEKRTEDLPLSSLRPDPWLGSEPLGHP